MSDETIVLKVVQSGEDTIEIDRAEYLDMKAEGSLYYLIIEEIRGINLRMTVTEPDGTTVLVGWDEETAETPEHQGDASPSE